MRPVRNDFRLVIVGIGVFLAFASTMTALAGTMLIWPGTRLDALWLLNESAHHELRETGSSLGPLFLALSITFGAASLGWFKQRVWGFRLTVAILCTQFVADLMSLARGDFLRGGVGVLIAGALLLYLLCSNIRTAFR
jgi:hypothetical protein